MKKSKYLMSLFRSPGKHIGIGSEPRPNVILHGRHGTAGPNDHDLWSVRTTLDERGRVTFTGDYLAKAYHFYDFCEHYGDNAGAGLWVMFTEDATIRAGDGIWMRPRQCMRAPRVEVL